ncbi:MAG: holo-ACP synthase [Actinomycetales bacterium]|nr:holo-ACP synthase [Actinomycetales bacterium]
MVLALGTDLVAVDRFASALRRTPRMRERLFTHAELDSLAGDPAAHRLAARFAAKEAVAKALGAPSGLSWHDCEVITLQDGRPSLRLSGSVAAAAQAQGWAVWEISLSHDGGFAMATVVALGAAAPQ